MLSVTCAGVAMTAMCYILLLQIIAILFQSPVLFMVHLPHVSVTMQGKTLFVNKT